MKKYISKLKKRIAQNKKTFIIYSILRMLVILTGIRCILTHNYESLFFCILSLILFLVPSFFEEKLKVNIPPLFQISIYTFIYAAEILGEVNKYYTAIPGWDTMLHTINGFLCAALGLSLIDIMNRGSKKLQLTPLYMSFMAFCFSMTIGVCWEFFEFSGDYFFHMDMQKDFIVQEISTVTLDPENSQKDFHIKDIDYTTIHTEDGEEYVVEGGYLDIGIIDTMKDLFVNFIGAIIFSVVGYIYEKSAHTKTMTEHLLITCQDEKVIKDI